MTKDRVYAFARKLQGMLKRARDMEAQIDDGEGFKALLADVNPAKALEVSKGLADARKALEEWVQAVAKESKRESLASAEELLTDLTSSLSLVEQAYDEWRATKQSYELATRTTAGALSPEEVKAWNERISAQKLRYDEALAMASDLVPSPGVIQL